MEVRCGSCNKLFRIADEKISGSGIKFACSHCHGPVKITREEFENYIHSKTAEPALPSVAQQSPKMEVRCGSCTKLFRISEDKITGSGIKFACSKCGALVTISKADLEKYKRNLEKAGESVAVSTEATAPLATASATVPKKPLVGPQDRQPPAAPASVDAERSLSVPPKPQSPSSEIQPPSPPTKTPVRPSFEPTGIVRPEPAVSASSETTPSSTTRQLMVLAVAVLIIAAVGYLAISRFKAAAPVPTEPVSTLTSIEGLQVLNTSADYDARGDYVISGDIVNTTDVERPGMAGGR